MLRRESPDRRPPARHGSVQGRRWPRPPLLVASIALITAVVIWIAVALLVVRGDITDGLPGGPRGFVVLAAGSCILDLVAVWLISRARALGPMFVYATIRALVATVGVLILTSPSYLVAMVALFASLRTAGPLEPHPFEPPGPTPPPAISLRSGQISSRQWARTSGLVDDAVLCVRCGQHEQARIHEVDDAGWPTN